MWCVLNCQSLLLFDPSSLSGHVWTRIVQKGANALGILKEYAAEQEVLDALLSQRRWRCGKRGAWYDRKACILMTHCNKNRATLEKALEVVIEGLEDNDTHISQCNFHPSHMSVLTLKQSIAPN